MTVVQLADLIKKYNLDEQGHILYYNLNKIGVFGFGDSLKGIFIHFNECGLPNIFNPIACDYKIQNMIKQFKENAIKNKLNDFEKDFENGT